ncbi:MAG: polyphosphate kinase 1 [Gaiellaceae bacterium]
MTNELLELRAGAPAVPRLSRELALLGWFSRVLELGEDEDVPLLERVRFCSIVSELLDEFFMVRVAGLLDQVQAGLVVRSPDGHSPQEELAQVQRRVRALLDRQSTLWTAGLRPALAEHGIVVAAPEDCSESERAGLETRFEQEIHPILTPLAISSGQPSLYVSNLSLSLGVLVRDPAGDAERFARVKVPEGLPRFHPVGGRGLLVPLESIIEHFMARLFRGMELSDPVQFRVSRDADFTISDEADDLLEAVEAEVRRRRQGDIVRLELSAGAAPAVRARLLQAIDVGDAQVYSIEGMLDLADLKELVALERPDLKYEPWRPRSHRRLTPPRDIFAELSRRDLLVQHPYDSFGTSVEAFVEAAAVDPAVAAIKTTIYRTSDDSAIAPALIRAAQAGKQTVCLIELKARFDESHNIEWSRRLEEAGVHVVYGYPDLKIHAKATLVVRQEHSGLRRYTHIGTGNYNAVTARLYEDLGLFTVDPEIGADVADLFDYITGFAQPGPFRKLLIAPLNLRERLIELIRGTARAAVAGQPARIRIKVNHLSDRAIVDELYDASRRRVPIELVARSHCALLPGIADLSETIHVRSIADRFLEHSRIYEFQAGEKTTHLIGSADLLPRNLDRRIEIVAPVADPRLQHELSSLLDLLLADNTNAWELNSHGEWHRISRAKGQRRHGVQQQLMRRHLHSS